jgi:hypothetical protein
MIAVFAFDEHGALNRPAFNMITVNVSQSVNLNSDNSTAIFGPVTLQPA